ncbi:MAG TPA: hypothetical protein VEL73_03005 [Mycobacteriales bacterium]|nr:hypothetical protein [Mycobacteriales bacterium]
MTDPSRDGRTDRIGLAGAAERLDRRAGAGGVARDDARRPPVDRARLAELTARETARFVAAHPRCYTLFGRSRRSMPAGVPMSWMAKWAGGFPVAVTEASGAQLRPG